MQERFDDAEAWWLRARDEAEAGFGPNDAHLAVIENGLAEVYRCAGGNKFAHAERHYRASIDILAREYGKDDVRCAQAVQYLGQYLSDAGRHAEAARLLRAAIASKQIALGKGHINVAEVRGVACVFSGCDGVAKSGIVKV